jgi:hypothetical protein
VNALFARAQWLLKLHTFGLLNNSLQPADEIRSHARCGGKEAIWSRMRAAQSSVFRRR